MTKTSMLQILSDVNNPSFFIRFLKSSSEKRSFTFIENGKSNFSSSSVKGISIEVSIVAKVFERNAISFEVSILSLSFPVRLSALA